MMAGLDLTTPQELVFTPHWYRPPSSDRTALILYMYSLVLRERYSVHVY